MFLLQQLIQLLSEPPGSIVYHLVTLFALQVVFAIGYTQYQRNREDDQAWRTAWAAGGIFVGRLILLVVGLSTADTPPQAVTLIPPLEQAVNTASIILLIWALVPPPADSPRLSDILAVSGVVITAVMALFFIQTWQTAVAQGSPPLYHTAPQAAIWHILQIALLAAGLILLLLRERTRRTLAPFIVGLLLLAHIASFANEPAYLLTSSNVPFWIRLGQLAAFPLWAVFAYQQSLRPLLETQDDFIDQSRRFAAVLDAISHMLSLPAAQRPLAALGLVETLLAEAEWVAVGRLASTTDDVPFAARESGGHGREFTLPLAEWPRLQTALTQHAGQVFLPGGVGARDWHAFYNATGLQPQGPMLAEPLLHGDQPVGLLLTGGGEALDDWSETTRSLAASIAPLLAIALADKPADEPAVPAVDASVELTAVRSERDALRAELLATQATARQTEQRLAATRKETQALAASLAALEAHLRDQETDS